MTVRTAIFKTLALILALYAAGEMCRTAAALTEAAAQTESLRNRCQDAALEIGALQEYLSLTPEELRVQAWRRYGLAAPEDVVFFDEG